MEPNSTRSETAVNLCYKVIELFILLFSALVQDLLEVHSPFSGVMVSSDLVSDLIIISNTAPKCLRIAFFNIGKLTQFPGRNSRSL